ncbi:MAG: nucleotidyltransferase domain-containing protein [Sulfolobus sp.]|nr:nucleotidyltransferase domain-containing protein [Sulfolobus sp.]
MDGFVYGSIARGDVHKDSDIDVIVFNPNILKLDLINADHKFIVQATPFSTPKAYISLDTDEKEVISFPLSKLKKDEIEFYWFGGLLSLEELRKDKRVPGVNKKLILIIPTQDGHEEIELKKNEDYASKILKISVDTIRERENLLKKRVERGHSGVFLTYYLSGEESIEDAMRILSKNNKYFRRAIESKL